MSWHKRLNIYKYLNIYGYLDSSVIKLCFGFQSTSSTHQQVITDWMNWCILSMSVRLILLSKFILIYTWSKSKYIVLYKRNTILHSMSIEMSMYLCTVIPAPNNVNGGFKRATPHHDNWLIERFQWVRTAEEFSYVLVAIPSETIQ